MKRLPVGLLPIGLLACLLPAVVVAQKDKQGTNQFTKPGDSGKAAAAGKEPELTLDDYKIPGNPLIIICDSPAKALKLIPGGFYVTPEKFKEFIDLEARVKQLESQLKPKKLRPYRCDLTGQLQGDFVELDAKYLLVTAQPGSTVALGCPGAFLMNADMGGQFPLLQNGADGYSIQVPKAGQHSLTLRVKFPVKSNRDELLGGGVERSFTLGLPGAAVMPALELKLPAGVKELRFNDLVEKQSTPQGDVRLWKVPLIGDLDKAIKLSWREPAGTPAKGNLVEAAWDVTTQLFRKQSVTTATLTLRDPRGAPVDVRLLLPKKFSKVEVKGADTSYQQTEEKSFSATALLRIQGPPAQQLEIVVKVEQETKPGARVAIGPYLALGVERQQGFFEIQAAPDVMQGQRLNYFKHIELRNVDVTEDVAKKKFGNLVDRFWAWEMAPGATAAAVQPAKAGGIGPQLELEFKPLQAQVETTVEHAFRLQPAAEGWHLVAVTRIHAVPLFGVDFLDVELPRANPENLIPVWPGPAEFEGFPFPGLAWLLQEPRWPVRPLEEFNEFQLTGEGAAAEAVLLPADGRPGPWRRIDLKAKQSGPFTVTLTRKYAVAAGLRQITLGVPRPVSLSDKGGKVVLDIDDDQLEAADAGMPAAVVQNARSSLTAHYHSAPKAVVLGWQPYRLELPVSITADVTLRADVAAVRQEIDFDLAGLRRPKAGADSAVPIKLALPPGLHHLVAPGGKLTLDKGKRSAVAEVPASGKLVLEYEIPLPGKAATMPDIPAPVHLPLVWPEAATAAQTTVRFWGGAGATPRLATESPAGEAWRNAAIADVPGKDHLPVLVVHSERLNPALAVEFESPQSPPADVVVDRALIQVVKKDTGGYRLRARYVVSHLDTSVLEVEFPMPVAQLRPSLVVRLADKVLTPKELADGSRIQLHVPRAQAAPLLLDVQFDVDAAEMPLLRCRQLLLQAPVLRGQSYLGRVRWQVSHTPGEVPLVLGGQDYSPPRWGWQNWLLTPETPLTGGDLEEWLTQSGEWGDELPAGVVFWSGADGAVRLLLVPRLPWLLVCSGGFLLLGLGVSFLPLRRVWFWLLVAVLCLLLFAATMLWPGMLPSLVYGAQVGAVVLAAILLLQWLLHQRYRRQMLFMPGFARTRKGSSISRTDLPVVRDRSTVDAVPLQGSKVGSSRVRSQ